MERPVLKAHRLLSVFWSRRDKNRGWQLASTQDDSRLELPAAKLTIRRPPEGVKSPKGGARLLASRESAGCVKPLCPPPFPRRHLPQFQGT